MGHGGYRWETLGDTEDSREELSPSPMGGGVLELEGCVVGAACEKGHLVEAQRSESWVVGREWQVKPAA